MQRTAFKRSRKWLTELVCDRHELLDIAIRQASPLVLSESIDWRSPRPPKYREYRDRTALRALDLGDLGAELTRFWPARGPVWDALGVGRANQERFLVEAKAHIQELVSTPTGAKAGALTRIRKRLTDLKRSLHSKAPADWAGTFYQYSNPLAYLDWLRRRQVPAFLVCIYFTHAPDVPEPVGRRQWEGALSVLHSYLGLGTHRLKPFILDLFLDATTGRVAA